MRCSGRHAAAALASAAAWPGRALFEDRVDQRDADGAAQVAHQVEQGAAVGDLTRRQRVERQPGRRQDAEHDAGAAHHLRPEQPVIVRRGGLEPVGDQAGREQAVAEGGQQARIDLGLEQSGDRRGHQLRRAGDDHDGADLPRRMLADEAQPQGKQVDRAVKAQAQHEAQRATKRESALLEAPKIDEGMGTVEAAPDRAGAGHDADGDAA